MLILNSFMMVQKDFPKKITGNTLEKSAIAEKFCTVVLPITFYRKFFKPISTIMELAQNYAFF